MTGIAWAFVRQQSPRRLLLLAGCAGTATAVLLVMVSILRLPAQTTEQLFQLLADTTLRGGVVLALALFVAPVLLLVQQTIRLGSARRDRRLAALRIVGATSAQVRGLGAAELGVPAAVGSVLGVGGYLVLRRLFGGRVVDAGAAGIIQPGLVDLSVGLIPTSVAPTWWQLALVVVGVPLVVAAMGWRASTVAIRTPVVASRRQQQRVPRPWGLVLVVLALTAFVAAVVTGLAEQQALMLVCVALAAVGMMTAGPWLAWTVGRWVEVRTSSVPLLLASRRLVVDPRAAGRAAAPLGLVGLIAGGSAVVLAELATMGQFEAFYVVSFGLVLVLLLIVALFVTVTLAVHAVESVTDHGRSTASLSAAGLPAAELERSLTSGAALVAVPVVAVGTALGAAPLLLMVVAYEVDEEGGLMALAFTFAGAALLVMAGVSWLAVRIAVRLVRPWSRRASRVEHLRTA